MRGGDIQRERKNENNVEHGRNHDVERTSSLTLPFRRSLPVDTSQLSLRSSQGKAFLTSAPPQSRIEGADYDDSQSRSSLSSIRTSNSGHQTSMFYKKQTLQSMGIVEFDPEEEYNYPQSQQSLRSSNTMKTDKSPTRIVIDEVEEKEQRTKAKIQLDLIRIDDDEEQENQDDSHPIFPREEFPSPPQTYPGAVAVRGPGYVSSDQSTAGSIVTGGQVPNPGRYTSSNPSENVPSREDLAIAAEVVPTEGDTTIEIEERVRQFEKEMERLHQVLQQTTQAEVLSNESQNNRIDLLSLEEEPGEVAVDQEVNTTAASLKRRKFRFCCIGILVTIIGVGIAIPLFLPSKDSSPPNSTKCATDADCIFDHSTTICTDGNCSIATCELNYANCTGKITDGCDIDLQTDTNHCGFCGNACILLNANSSCVGGQCAILSCTDGFADCDKVPNTGCEINLNASVKHCGACDMSCDSTNSTCVKGECFIDECTNGLASCDGLSTTNCVVNLTTNENHCGSCGNACILSNANSKCVGGKCLIDSCKTGYANCDGESSTGCEAHLQTDANQCGFCNTPCTLFNANSSCVEGQCTIYNCMQGFANCDGISSTGCEIDMETNVNHCGACDVSCDSPNSKCEGGKCVIDECTNDLASCDGLSTKNCVVNLTTDENHCGSCGNACSLPNANSKCVEGTCVIDSCKTVYADCDGISSTGCETNLQTDVDNCGLCGSVCKLPNGQTHQCIEGQCTILGCIDGHADCDGISSTGCEINTETNVNHCGSCGNICSLSSANSKCEGRICVIDECMDNFANCDGSSTSCDTNLNTDKYNCGSCGNTCSLPNANSECVGGTCTIDSCKTVYADCDGISSTGCETNLQTDVDNCGSCGSICKLPNGQTHQCIEGQCTILGCIDGYADCDGISSTGCEINTETNVNHCGACGNKCSISSANSKCEGGICVIDECMDNFANCDGSSTSCDTNLNTDKYNCGSCGNTCSLPNANSKCVGGTCTIDSCKTVFADCDGQSINGCEVNLIIDANNCGMCNTVCSNADSQCVGGLCETQCPEGFENCDGKSSTGCETNVNSNLNHCGECNMPCSLANANSECVGGKCVIKNCWSGYDDCDGNPITGCETNVNTNINCGSCNTVCSNADSQCVGGLCETQCPEGFENCDGKSSTGCETNVNSNLNHCGECNMPCSLANANSECVGGKCVIKNCWSGYDDCDGNPITGCETNVNTNINCGSCNTVCSNADSQCVGGLCETQCPDGFENCDGDKSTGCETNVNTNINCGSCGKTCTLANAYSKCVDRSCAIENCWSGYDNCDSDPRTGCETNVNTNANCGSCNTVCSNADSQCVERKCETVCPEGFENCDGKSSTGCETNVNTNINCGSCGKTCSLPKVCIDGNCDYGSVQIGALMGLYESTNGDAWGINTDWGQPDECNWHGVTCDGSVVKKLDVKANNLVGTIPSELGRLTKLTFLHLGQNTGLMKSTIPSTFGRLTDLRYLSIDLSGLSGTIPTEFGKMTSLTTLYLYNNEFAGTLPAEMAALTKLTTTWIHNNKLTQIPSNVCNMLRCPKDDKSFRHDCISGCWCGGFTCP